jgi:hypothetical protein
MAKLAFRSSPVEHLERRVFLAAQPYSWQNADIGGGGFVDGVFFSPSQQNVIYVRTDIGGLYKTTNGGTTWKPLLDFVGPASSPFGFGTDDQDLGVLSFAIDPENPNNIYADVGQYSGTNGAVLYSTDAGTTWGETNLSFYVGGNANGRGEGERIAVDPHDSSIVMLGSNDDGLWKSTNSGHSFNQVPGISTTASVNFVYFNPYGGTAGNATQNIYVGLNSITGLSPQTAAAEPTNLFQTSNGGSTWTQVAGSSTSPGKNVASTSVSSLSRSNGTATAHTSSATSIEPGDLVTIAGASPSACDGTFTVASITNSTTFTYAVASGTDTATGTITASVNYSEMPNHVALASDGNLYLTYSDAQAPNGTQTTGGVYRYNTSNGAWAVISPQVPGVAGAPQYGYMGLALDPESPTTIVVTTINDYSGPDAIYRTTNANATAPTWVPLYSTGSAQNFGYGGYDTTRNTSTAPWVAPFGDGIGNWPCSVAIDPFNSGHILYGNGQGLWATNIGNSSTPLTGANSWYFPDNGIEFTSVGSLVAPASGVPLFSAIGDISGFAHTTLTTSPAAGTITNGAGPLDFDQTNSNYVVDLGYNSTGGLYTTNDGVTWTAFGSEAGSGGGSIAVAPAPSGAQPTLVWDPSSSLPYYSANNGTTWTASNMPSGTLTGGHVISDRVANGTFYYTTENSNDNQFSTYKSTNGGATFTLSSQLGTGNATLVANPFVAGDLWLADYSGLYHSTNYGSSYSAANGNNSTGVVVQYGYSVALGAPAPGTTNAAIYLWGQLGGVTGLFRSDDFGANFVQINDSAHQWGGQVQTLAADPNVFGRVYLGINGRGIIIGNPAGNLPASLPAGWSDSDINTPGNPGWATSSTTLSNSTVVNQWTVNGGGAGIAGTSDQFNFASETVTGDTSVIAQLTALNNSGTGTPQAGVMFRAGSSAATDPFAAIVQNTANQLVFEYRTTSGGSIASTALSGVGIGAEYMDLVRHGSNYSAYYGTDGIHWTQLGSAVTIAAIPSNASAGLAVTSNYNPQLSSATFGNVQIIASTLNLTGPAFYLKLDSDARHLDIWTNTTATGSFSQQVLLFNINAVAIQGNTATGSVVVDFSAGSPLPSGGLTCTGGTGAGNSLLVIGSPGADTIASSAGQFVINGQAINSSNIRLTTFTPGAGTDSLSVASGILQLAPPAASTGITPMTFSSITIGNGARLVVATPVTTATRSVLITSSLNLAQSAGAWTASLDLSANDLLIHGGMLSTLTGQTQSGYNGGNWLGTGITSSAAADSTHLTALGVIQNSIDGTTTGTPLYGTFDGISPLASTDTLVKYTYVGDANLDGKVDGSDYTRIDAAWQTSQTGWYNGDFNYDGSLNGSDYTLIDNVFNTQHTSLAEEIAAPAAQEYSAHLSAATGIVMGPAIGHGQGFVYCGIAMSPQSVSITPANFGLDSFSKRRRDLILGLFP